MLVTGSASEGGDHLVWRRWIEGICATRNEEKGRVVMRRLRSLRMDGVTSNHLKTNRLNDRPMCVGPKGRSLKHRERVGAKKRTRHFRTALREFSVFVVPRAGAKLTMLDSVWFDSSGAIFFSNN